MATRSTVKIGPRTNQYENLILCVVTGEVKDLRVKHPTAKLDSVKQLLIRARGRLGASVRIALDGDAVVVSLKEKK